MIPYCILVIENDDDRAFMENLYQEYRFLIYSEIRKIIKNEWDIEDVVQIVLINLIKKIATLKSLNRVRLINYIISTSKHTAYNYIREQKNGMTASYEELWESSQSKNGYATEEIENLLIVAEKIDCLTLIWPKLDERTKFLLEGYYILEKSMAELSVELGIKSSSVRMALVRARHKAYALLKQMLYPEDRENT